MSNSTYDFSDRENTLFWINSQKKRQECFVYLMLNLRYKNLSKWKTEHLIKDLLMKTKTKPLMFQSPEQRWAKCRFIIKVHCSEMHMKYMYIDRRLEISSQNSILPRKEHSLLKCVRVTRKSHHNIHTTHEVEHTSMNRPTLII